MTAGPLTWREPDGLVGTIDRFDATRWHCTVTRTTRSGRRGETAAVRSTREGAVAAVQEVLAVAREVGHV